MSLVLAQTTFVFTIMYAFMTLELMHMQKFMATKAHSPGPSSQPSTSADQRQLLEDETYRDGIRQLHAALWDERRAIQVYLDIVSLHILTPEQEAWLDAVSDTRPWWPDWWTMGNILASQHAKPPVGQQICRLCIYSLLQSAGQLLAPSALSCPCVLIRWQASCHTHDESCYISFLHEMQRHSGC